MALATRNLYLVLKARDEASRVVRGFGRELTRTGAIADAEGLRQRAAAIALASAQETFARQEEINSLRRRAAAAAERAVIMRSQGAADRDIQIAVQQSKRLRNQASELARETALLAQRSKLAASELRDEASELERGHRSALRFTNALHTVSATLVTVGSGLAFVGAGGLYALYNAVQAAADYERQVRLTATQVDNFKASLQELGDVGFRVANEVAVKFEEVQPALYNILSSTNANLKQAEILLQGFSRTAVAGMVTIEDAARGTIPILNAFNIPLEDVNRILDIQFQLVRKGVGTYEEFSKVFGRVVPSATRSGQNFETISAMLAYLTRNGLSAAMAATSAARALEALSHPKAVGELEKLGIKMRDLKGNFVPLDQILTQLRTKLNKLPPADRVKKLVDIFRGAGGTIQARRFLEQVLLRPGELEEFIGFLDDMKSSSGAFGSAYDQMAASVAAQTELMRNKWKILSVTVGRIVTPAFITVIGWVQKALDWFNKLSPKTQKFIVIGVTLASALAIVSGVIVVLLGLVAGLVAAITAAGAVFFYLVGGVAAVVTGLGALAAIFVLAWTRSENFRKLLLKTRDAFIELYQRVIKPTAQQIKDDFEKKILPPMRHLWEIIETKVMPVVLELQQNFREKLIPAATEVANIIKGGIGSALRFAGFLIERYVIPMVDMLTKFYHEHKETIDMVISAMFWLGKQFAKFVAILIAIGIIGLIVGLVAVIGSLISIFYALAQAVIWVVDKGRDIVNWIKSLGPRLADLSGAWTQAMAFLKTIPGKITTAVGDLSTLLLDAGKSLMSGLLKGIESKFGELKNLGKLAAQTFKDFWPFSPAKKGPLSGKGGMFYSGRALMKQLAEGVRSTVPSIGVASSARAGAIADRLATPAGNSSRHVTQTFNITTQELNPRRLSQELGFELAGRS